MSRSGPDSASSWIIASACCFINMMMYGMARLSGVLFVASIPRFNVGREQASFPYTFANFMRNTPGPLVGYLGEKIGVRPVTTFGCLLAGIGVGSSFLAEDINTVTILWGIIFGIGFGLGNILLPVKINQYFDKHRATASGISFSGACLGSFILPLIVENLLEIYGLSGTYLILGGLVLNCVPAALLLRKPNFTIKPSSSPHLPSRKSGSESQVILKKVKLYTVEDDDCPSKRTQSMKSVEGGPSTFTSLSYEERIKRLSTQTLLSTYSVRMSTPDALDVEQILENSKGRRQVDQEAVECEVNSLDSSATDSVIGHVLEDAMINSKSFVGNDCGNHLGKENMAYSRSLSDLYINSSHQVCHNSTEKNHPEVQKSNAFRVVFDPLFVLLAVTNAIYCFTFVCMFTVIVDFARDINIAHWNEKYILMSLSVGDFLGRIGLGWVTDKGYMTRTTFAAACFLFQGISTAAIAWSTGFLTLLILSFLYGLSEAGLIVIYPLIMAEYIDGDKQTVAISSSNFLAGPLCLTIAPLIGFFRDKVGSYEYIFIGIGVISILCCFSFLLVPVITKNRKPAK